MKSILILIISIFCNLILADNQTGFVFFGDSGTGSEEQYRVAKGIKRYCQKARCDFVALLGDNIYENGVKNVDDPQWKVKFEDPYKILGLDFFAALGNHDYAGNIQAQIDYSKKSTQWKMPGRYYAYKKEVVEFFVVDTNRFDEQQMAWLREGLSKSTSPWKIVYGHHPIYSYGVHGNNDLLISKLYPLIKDKADYYLAGHDHSLQVIVKDSLPEYIVSGTAAKLTEVKAGQASLFSQSVYGFSHLLLTQNKSELNMLNENGKSLFKKVKIKKKN